MFWENAVSASNEMLDLLVFAFLIYCLLRFRITQNERWLQALSLVYGLGVDEQFCVDRFSFRCSLVALIWIKGAGFFNWRFILRMVGPGCGGPDAVPAFAGDRQRRRKWPAVRRPAAA